MVTEFNLSSFAIRYLTRIGLMPLVKKRTEEYNNCKLADFIKNNGFFLSGLFHWESTPEGHLYWQVLSEKIGDQYSKFLTNKISKA